MHLANGRRRRLGTCIYSRYLLGNGSSENSSETSLFRQIINLRFSFKTGVPFFVWLRTELFFKWGDDTLCSQRVASAPCASRLRDRPESAFAHDTACESRMSCVHQVNKRGNAQFLASAVPSLNVKVSCYNL